MKPCVLFNPVARGEKAAAFRVRLEGLRGELELRQTTSPESARALAAEAVQEGFETVVAVGGDGTFNEVLNGVASESRALDRVRLGLLPLGTANVFAKELRLPMDLDAALDVLRQRRERRLDLAVARFQNDAGRPETRYFSQLAGAGLDVRSIELVNWETKKRFGALAYVEAGLRAIREEQVRLTVSNGKEQFCGELILVGNGQYYGGRFELFPGAHLTDGMLHALVFEQVRWQELIGRGWGLMTQSLTQQTGMRLIRGSELSIASDRPASFQLEGDRVGPLPCAFEVFPERLRMIVP